MSLSSATSSARNALRATTDQLDQVSRNMAGARDPNYARRDSYLHSRFGGGVDVSIRRSNDPQLFNNFLAKGSQAHAAQAVAGGLDVLSGIYGTDDFAGSPSKLLEAFKKALQTYADQGGAGAAGRSALDSARDLANSLNAGSRAVQKTREDADREIKAAIDHINDLLNRFDAVDREVVQEKADGGDYFSAMDERDGILKELSKELGITVVNHADGSTTLYGLDGSTLYDKGPRKLTFEPSVSLPAGAYGSPVLVDGVPLGHDSFVHPNGSGRLGGLLKLRDDIAPEYQRQLDEMAKALYDIFKGKPAMGDKKAVPSLFDNGGDNRLSGFAGRLKLNPLFEGRGEGEGPQNFDPNDEAGSGAFVQVIQDLIDHLDDPAFGPAGEGGKQESLTNFANDLISWLEGKRADASKEAQTAGTAYQRAGDALSNAVGVNTDDELALMLQLEQSYSASARILNTVGKMLDDVLAMAR
ncbi:flagellar hook-associated protein FlgK [Bartonella sp. DGB2]|uniref:flagellar hook-associated protein FlgK n=1 Tax=Bartonella sp. DGB2 TaxID=3388426 RepID=UPI00398FA5FB